MKIVLLAFILSSILFFSNAQKTSILFLGNSYTQVNNLPETLYNLALSGNDTIAYDSNTPGGYTFQLHTTNTTSLAKIKSQPWD